MRRLPRTHRWMPSAFGALALWACQGEYPLAPTVCDDWCNASEPVECEFYSPSSCVRQCEEAGYSTLCSDELSMLMTCMKEHPKPHMSCYDFVGAIEMNCEGYYSALLNCATVPARE